MSHLIESRDRVATRFSSHGNSRNQTQPFTFSSQALSRSCFILPPISSATTTTTTSSTMTKASLIPASAPTSPLVHRNKQNHQPTTPQRPLHHSASARHYASPFTPATSISTPYTPLSLRSFSSNGSSLATPASAVVNRRRNLSLSLTSPEVHGHGHAQNRSLADIAQNWRTRANENGIKVSPGDESKFQRE